MSLLVIFRGVPAPVVAVIPVLFTDQAVVRGRAVSPAVVRGSAQSPSVVRGRGTGSTKKP